MKRDRPSVAGATKRPGLLDGLGTRTVGLAAQKANTFPSEIRRSLAEFQKCAARFDDSNSSTVSVAVLGVALIAEDLLHLCRQYRDALPEHGRLGGA